MAEAINRGSYKQVTLGDKWDVIVIGSGIGGLTAAVLLSVYGGKRVLVLERHYVMGGFTHTFRRPGYEWDVGLHYIGQVQDDTSSVRRAFDHVTGGKVRWNAMPEVYDRIIVDGQTFDLIRGLEQYREGMKRDFPSEVRAIDKYIAAVQSSNRAAGLYYAEKAVPELLSRIAGGLMRAVSSLGKAYNGGDTPRSDEQSRLDGRAHWSMGGLRSSSRAKQFWHSRHNRRTLL